VNFTFTLDVKMRELSGLVTLMQETTLLPTNGPVALTQLPIHMVPIVQRVELTTLPYPVLTLRILEIISPFCCTLSTAGCLIKRKENITVNELLSLEFSM
jgi:hypothetical protein